MSLLGTAELLHASQGTRESVWARGRGRGTQGGLGGGKGTNWPEKRVDGKEQGVQRGAGQGLGVAGAREGR